MMKICLFGRPEILDGKQEVRVTRRKSRAMVYYLAAQERAISRERLLGIFWPDTPRTAAQQTLRTSLHGLRKALGEALVVVDDRLGIAPEVWVDARQFEAELAKAGGAAESLGEALKLYRGDFLADFSLPEDQEFEDWASAQREFYRRLAIRGLAELSKLHAHQGEFSAALAPLEQALNFNPFQEDLQRERIRLLYLAGDRPGAIQRYDELRRLLDEEMGVPPMAETRALYDDVLNDHLALPPAGLRLTPARLSRGEGSLTRPHPGGERGRKFTPRHLVGEEGRLPFTGRREELRRLKEEGGGARLALLEGEAGIGKTRLAEEFMRTSRGLALVGRARELEQGLPYQPLIEALRSLLAFPEWAGLQPRVQARLLRVWLVETARLLPELNPEGSGGQLSIQAAEEPRLWEGVNQFLHAVAGAANEAGLGSLFLFLDDLHWADTSTVAMLGYLVRQGGDAGLYFLGAARPAQPRTPLGVLRGALVREGRLVSLPLARLEPAEVESLAATLSPVQSLALAGWLLQTSEGNPYILAELVRHARATHILEANGSFRPEAFSGQVLVPQTIYSLIQTRLEQLSDAAHRVLDAAVAAGREFEFEAAGRAAGISETAALDALDELLAAGLIHPLDERRFTFDHTLTMEVAYREVGEYRHRRMHRRVAEALEALYRDRLETITGQLAFHFWEGNDPQRAAPYAFQAGKQAARLAAWNEAAVFYQHALEGTPAEQSQTVWQALGEAYTNAGQFAQASEALRRALAVESNDSQRKAEIQLSLAFSYLPQARFGEAIQLAQGLCAAAGYKGDGGAEQPATAMMAELTWGRALSIEGADLEEARLHLEAAEDLWRKLPVGEQSILAQIKFELGSVTAQQGDLRKAIRLYRESLAAAEAVGEELAFDQRILANNNLAYHLLLLGDPTAQEYAETGLALAQERGAVGLLPYLYSTLGEIALASGDIDRAEEHFQAGLAIAERFVIPERVAGLTANLGLAAQAREEPALAIHRLSKALGLADAAGTQHLAAQIRVWLAPLLPQAEAQARLEEARAIAEGSGRKRLMEEIEKLRIAN